MVDDQFMVWSKWHTNSRYVIRLFCDNVNVWKHHLPCRQCLVFSIFSYNSILWPYTRRPPTSTMTFLGDSEQHRRPPSSLEGWKLISSRSTSHNLFPHWMMSSSPISPLPQAVISSYLGATKKRCLPFSSYFISSLAHSHMIIAGSQGHYQETRRGEPKTFYFFFEWEGRGGEG